MKVLACENPISYEEWKHTDLVKSAPQGIYEIKGLSNCYAIIMDGEHRHCLYLGKPVDGSRTLAHLYDNGIYIRTNKQLIMDVK